VFQRPVHQAAGRRRADRARHGPRRRLARDIAVVESRRHRRRFGM
jgi:hypothetical protein